MTKKTNCVLMRAGQSLFWQYKKSNFFITFKFKTFLNFCHLQLKKLNIIFLNLDFYQNYIYIYVYILLSDKLLNKKLNFYQLKENYKIKKKSLNNLKLKQLYLLTNKYNIYIKTISLKCLMIKSFNQFKYLMQLYYLKKIYLQLNLRFKTKLYDYIQTVTIFYIKLNNAKALCYNMYYSLNKLLNVRFSNLSLKKKFFLGLTSKQIKKYFKSIILKKQEIYFENMIFSVYDYKFNIKLINILHNIYINKILSYDLERKNNFILKGKRKRKEKKYSLLLFIFFLFRHTELITRVFGYMLLKTKKHIKNISIFIKKIYKLYFNKIINFKGYKIAICGKLNGKMKRQKYKFKIGKIMLNSLHCRIDYFYLPLYTKYGVFSIKIWLNY